jgi:hypothetical protein
MLRILAASSLSFLFATAAAGQCLDTSSPGGTLGSGDSVLLGPVLMNISFPMAGGPYTHCVVNGNGAIYLTTGGAAVDANGMHSGSVARLRGIAGASPRIAPFWSDLVTTAPASFIATDASVPGRFAVTWVSANEWLQLPTKSFSAELFSNGTVRFAYSAGMAVEAFDAVVGVSIGNAVADPGASNLSAGANSATGILYEVFDPFAAPFDLPGHSITLTPSGAGWQATKSCEPANHSSYGQGCYSVASESFYQHFATAAAASAALSGQSMRIVPTANGYSATWGGGSYVAPPGGAVTLALGDDDQVSFSPSLPLPVPGGTAPTLWVHANGFVSTGAGNDAPYGPAVWNPPSLEDFAPSASFRNAPATAFWSWHDMNPTEGLGRVKRHEAVVGPDTILYVTWDAVESYPLAVSNPSTFQFQFNLSTGAVTWVWQNITSVGSGNPDFPEDHVVGYSPGGASFDTGSVTLSSALPLVTSPDLRPLTLTAAPEPVFSLGGSSVPVTWQIDNVRDLSPPLPDVYLLVLVASLGQGIGIDLGAIGFDAPGCPLHLASLDVVLQVAATGPTAQLTIAVPQPLSPGDVFYFQALNFLIPNSLPNGQNGLGLTVSNGLRSHFQTF